MKGKKLSYSVDMKESSTVSREKMDEILHIFSLMGVHKQSDLTTTKDQYPLFKKPSLLKPLTRGLKISDGFEDTYD